MIKRISTLAVAAVLFVIGLVGLVIPVLPGFLFLLLALVCLSTVSSTVRGKLERNRHWRRWQLRWRSSAGLPLLNRLQLAFWLSADATVNSIRR